MATVQGTTGSNEAAILNRVIRPEKDDRPDERAKALLRMKFEQSDLDRLHELVVKNQDDELTPAEKQELEDYLRVSAFLDLMHAKARYSLRKKNERQPRHGCRVAATGVGSVRRPVRVMTRSSGNIYADPFLNPAAESD
jgi:hypothetical protein